MAEIVNLRQARKARARNEKEKTAAENRRRHGRTKADKQAEKAALEKSLQHIDGHKRET